MTLSLEKDGVPLTGSPFTRNLTLAESQEFNYAEANDGNTTTFSAVPAEQIADIRCLLITADQTLTFRFDGQTDVGITINAGGLLFFFDSNINSGAGSSNASVNNNSGSVATVKGFAGGD